MVAMTGGLLWPLMAEQLLTATIGTLPTDSSLWYQDINGLEAGVYSVTISDANGCEFTIGAINLIQPDQLLPEIIDVVHESCLGNNDGSALVNGRRYSALHLRLEQRQYRDHRQR